MRSRFETLEFSFLLVSWKQFRTNWFVLATLVASWSTYSILAAVSYTNVYLLKAKVWSTAPSMSRSSTLRSTDAADTKPPPVV